MDVVVAPEDGGVVVLELGPDGRTGAPRRLEWEQLPGCVRALEPAGPRWVWADTAVVYPRLLRARTPVARAHDLRLAHAVLVRSTYLADGLPSAADDRWGPQEHPAADAEPSLLDLPTAGGTLEPADVLAEHRVQQQAVTASAHAGRLRLLLAAESAGALVAAELTHVGLPFDAAAHDALLTQLLGPQPLPGGRPAALEALAARIRAELGAPGLNPDSPPEVLRALHGAGVEATTTRQSELERFDHPAVAPLLEYKKLARLLGANGWAWLSDWVHDGRFRPDYLPAGVVTGRWATRGGGALQLPKQVRAAVVAGPGRRLVVADAAQLEPRVLAAMSDDRAMARASRAGDLYQALVDQGAVDTRAHAKVAMLGALYGATSGEAGQLMPRLLRSYPAATGWVEAAARAGERGEVVTTWLGRSSPVPPDSWREAQRRAGLPEATAAEQRRARAQARDWGRFTRNFVVQGTAAEWALCWLADLRRRLGALPPVAGRSPALVYFLHDEVIVETPAELAEEVADAVREAAHRAGRLLFGDSGVTFVLDVACVGSYAEAG